MPERRAVGGPPLLRQINAAAVLGRLHGAGPLRVAEIAALTGLSQPTVRQVVTALHRDGWVLYENVDQDGRLPGRPPRLVRFRADAGYVAGIDIGAHKVLA